jgi:DNA repair exonuclease SbcCD ATPase subunit
MPFTVNDLQDLTRILIERPEWLNEMRRILLTNELLALPSLVQELAEIQRRTEIELAEFRQRMEAELAEFRQRTEAELAELRRYVDTRFAELAEIQRRTEVELAEFRQRVEAELAELRRYVDMRFAQLGEAQQRVEAELAELRRYVDMRFAELAEIQRRTEAELAKLRQRMEAELAELRQRMEAELAEQRRYVDARFAELAEAQQRIEVELAELRRRTDERFAQLAESQLRIQEQLLGIKDELADVRGRQLELEYRIKVAAFFGGWLRKPAVVEISDIWDQLEEHLDEIDMRRLTAVDLIVRGQLPKKRGGGEVWLAVEVSNVVDLNDVERAIERAALLRRAGLPAIPVVGGKRLTRGAAASVAERRVVLSKGGELVGWDEMLDSTLGAS